MTSESEEPEGVLALQDCVRAEGEHWGASVEQLQQDSAPWNKRGCAVSSGIKSSEFHSDLLCTDVRLSSF